MLQPRMLIFAHFELQYLYLEVGSASHKSCAASVRATTLKILRRKRFRKPKK